MKKVQCIIRPQKLECVKKALAEAGIIGITVREVSGHGRQKGFIQRYRGAENLVTLLPKIEIDIVVLDENLEKTITTVLNSSKTGELGDGKIFVSDIIEAVRIRTGERGEKAI